MKNLIKTLSIILLVVKVCNSQGGQPFAITKKGTDCKCCDDTAVAGADAGLITKCMQTNKIQVSAGFRTPGSEFKVEYSANSLAVLKNVFVAVTIQNLDKYQVIVTGFTLDKIDFDEETSVLEEKKQDIFDTGLLNVTCRHGNSNMLGLNFMSQRIGHWKYKIKLQILNPQETNNQKCIYPVYDEDTPNFADAKTVYTDYTNRGFALRRLEENVEGDNLHGLEFTIPLNDENPQITMSLEDILLDQNEN